MTFQTRLQDLAGISTIGVSTAEGVSPHNAALERLAWAVSELPTPEAQADALEQLLKHSGQLPPDQHAHVIATIIHDLVMPGRIVLQEGCQARVGSALLHAGLNVAPDLVQQSVAYEVLKLHLQRLAHRQECHFGDDVYDLLDDVGFNAPSLNVTTADNAKQSAYHQADWLRNRVFAKRGTQLQPNELAALADEAAALPEELRGGPGGVVTLLVNQLADTIQNSANDAANERIWHMVEQLPDALRITALEAYYNQMNLISHETARRLHERVRASATALRETASPAWFNRSRADLVAILNKQHEVLESTALSPGESLSQFEERSGREADPNTAWLFSHMRLRSGR